MKLSYYVRILLLWIGLVLETIDIANAGVETNDDFPFTSVVDILSQNVEFSTFLRAVQRNGLIPYLNELQNFTLMAPVNSAFIHNEQDGSNDYIDGFDIENYLIHDSVLLTSALNEGVFVFSEGVKFPCVLERLSDDSIIVNGVRIVDADLLPNFQNASVHGIQREIHTPLGLESFLRKLEHDFNEFYFFNKFARNIPLLESMVTNRTILIPSDSSWLRFFSEIEINYIIDAFNNLEKMSGNVKHIWNADRQNFIQNIVMNGIFGGEVQREHGVKNLNGVSLDFKSENHGSTLVFNGSKSSDIANLVFYRGLIHSFDNLEIIKHIVNFNAEKYLHGLNSSEFVEELYFRDLEHLIKDSKEAPYGEKTIFVPNVLTDGGGFSRSELLYHFVNGKIWLDREFAEDMLEESRMFNSKFCDSGKRLGDNCQRMKIIKDHRGYVVNEKYKIIHKEPFEIGNTLIYLISDKIKLPGDLTPSVNPFYGCSRSLTFLSQLDILDLPLNKQGYTVLLPCFDSWEFLELNLEFLQNNMTALNSIMKNLIIDGLIYSDSKDTAFKTKNLLQDTVTVRVERTGNGKQTELSLNMSTMGVNLEIEGGLDLFFSQGVIHPLKQLYFPKSVSVSLMDLIHTTGTYELIDLFKKFNDLFSIIQDNMSYSILVPMQSSLSLVGDILNSTRLLDFLKLHIIDGDFTSKLLHCEDNITTLLGDSLSCRKDIQQNYFIGVLDGAEREVRIIKKGCSSHNSCVFLIDRPISLQWLNRRKIWFQLPKSPLVIILFIETVILIIGLSLLFSKKLKYGVTPSPIIHEDEEISRPLIGPIETPNHVEENESCGDNA